MIHHLQLAEIKQYLLQGRTYDLGPEDLDFEGEKLLLLEAAA